MSVSWNMVVAMECIRVVIFLKYILKIKMTGFAGGLNAEMWSKCVKVDILTKASSSGASCLLSKP